VRKETAESESWRVSESLSFSGEDERFLRENGGGKNLEEREYLEKTARRGKGLPFRKRSIGTPGKEKGRQFS